MEKIMKYEDLYQPIKDEIENYYQNKKVSIKELQLEERHEAVVSRRI